jgi:hypothetical protein
MNNDNEVKIPEKFSQEVIDFYGRDPMKQDKQDDLMFKNKLIDCITYERKHQKEYEKFIEKLHADFINHIARLEKRIDKLEKQMSDKPALPDQHVEEISKDQLEHGDIGLIISDDITGNGDYDVRTSYMFTKAEVESIKQEIEKALELQKVMDSLSLNKDDLYQLVLDQHKFQVYKGTIPNNGITNDAILKEGVKLEQGKLKDDLVTIDEKKETNLQNWEVIRNKSLTYFENYGTQVKANKHSVVLQSVFDGYMNEVSKWIKQASKSVFTKDELKEMRAIIDYEMDYDDPRAYVRLTNILAKIDDLINNYEGE